MFFEILKNHTAGDPMNPSVKWTNLKRREISEGFAAKGVDVSMHVVKQLLDKHGYVKRKMKKTATMKETKNRNEQKIEMNNLKGYMNYVLNMKLQETQS